MTANPSIQDTSSRRTSFLGKGMEVRRGLLAWALIIPITLVHLVVVVGPGISGLYYALTDWSGIGKAEFIGLGNFVELFTEDLNFRAAFRHNLFWMAFFLTVPMIMALSAASLLAQIRRGAMMIRSMFYLPYVLPSIVSAFTWSMLLNPTLGIGAALDRSASRGWIILGSGIFEPPWLQSPSRTLALVGVPLHLVPDRHASHPC